MSTPAASLKNREIYWATYMEDIRRTSRKGKFAIGIFAAGAFVAIFGAAWALLKCDNVFGWLPCGNIPMGSAWIAGGGALMTLALALIKDDESLYIRFAVVGCISATLLIILTAAEFDYTIALVTVLLFLSTVLAEALYLQGKAKKYREQEQERKKEQEQE